MRMSLSTGQVAERIGVCRNTVVSWADSGRLHYFRRPGSKVRRILHSSFVEIAKECQISVADVDDEGLANVFVVSSDKVLIAKIRQEMPPEMSYRVDVAADGFEAGTQIESFCPDCVVCDYDIGRTPTIEICRLKKLRGFKHVILIALLPGDSSSNGFDRAGINKAFIKPFDEAMVARQIHNIIRSTMKLP